MAQFEVFRARDGDELLIDCQANILSHMESRFVVPLLKGWAMPKPTARLNPRFDIEGEAYFMATQGAATIPARMLGRRVASFVDERDTIIAALDMLITGF